MSTYPCFVVIVLGFFLSVLDHRMLRHRLPLLALQIALFTARQRAVVGVHGVVHSDGAAHLAFPDGAAVAQTTLAGVGAALCQPSQREVYFVFV